MNDKINEKIIVHKQMFSLICLYLHKVKSCERLELCERLKCLREKIVHRNFSYISILLVVCERCERCERLLFKTRYRSQKSIYSENSILLLSITIYCMIS